MSRDLKACFSHKSDDWATPSKLYNAFMINGFIDPCPLHCTVDNLDKKFNGKLFINPPYSQIAKWVDFAIKQYELGNYVCMLLPVRTDTKWFFKLYPFIDDVICIKGRLKFNNSKSAPFPSMLVILGEYRLFTLISCLTLDSLISSIPSFNEV